MKRLKLLWILLPLLAGTSCSSYLRVTATSTVTPRAKGDFTLTGVMPDGKRLLVSKPLYSGLYLVDIRSGATRTVTDAPGAGYQPAISPDGSRICFRTDDFTDGLRTSDLIVKDLLTGDSTPLLRRGRVVSPPQAVGKDIAYSVEGRQKVGGFQKNIFGHAISKRYVMLEDLTPVLISEGEKRTLKPGGDGSYIWVSLSPDRRRMVYYLAGKGSFVCSLSGKTLLTAPNLLNPRWLKNGFIVGIEPHGREDKSTATDLVAYCVRNGKRSVLTNTASVNERNPHSFEKGRKVAIQTSAGILNILNVRRK